ncbi:thiol S-methyltransferase TMT1A-like [Brachyhypopomus gauderio]|uniref:thiol S-methyltransferase TMT1A-like n=1 Tax=Brachyhypopomus gauderio TaxID=698409 RepID=UPI00404273CD
MALLMHSCTLLAKILVFPLYLAQVCGLYKFYKRIFPAFVYKVTFRYNEIMKDKKRELFRSLTKFYPPNGPLRLLEVGCGTGANFEHYPTGCKVTCIDSNPYCERYLKMAKAKNEHLVYERFVVASGEDLRAVEDNSVDVVVCTLVLCSVNNPPKVLQEAKRVLRPGGGFFFMEHVVADPTSLAYFFQHVFEPFWYYFCDGCEITRATWQHIEAAGFSDLELHHIKAPLNAFVKPHIVGYAVK